MKAYGIPRVPWTVYPNIVYIHLFGFKSSIGKLRKKGGDIPSCFRSSVNKRRTRRIWKKKERAMQKEELRRTVWI